jgi:hypothetical protein
MVSRKPAYIRRLNKRRASRSEYCVEQPSAPPPSGPRACSRRQEGDEYVCHCGARWDIHDDRPPCRFNGGY